MLIHNIAQVIAVQWPQFNVFFFPMSCLGLRTLPILIMSFDDKMTQWKYYFKQRKMCMKNKKSITVKLKNSMEPKPPTWFIEFTILVMEAKTF